MSHSFPQTGQGAQAQATEFISLPNAYGKQVRLTLSGGMKPHLHPQNLRHSRYLALRTKDDKQNYTKGSRTNETKRTRV